MKSKRKVGSKARCFVVLFLLTVTLIFSLHRETMRSVSPDGKLTAQGTKPSFYDDIFLSYDESQIQLELMQNSTGERIVVEKESSGGLLGDTVNPIGIIWHHDNQRFA